MQRKARLTVQREGISESRFNRFVLSGPHDRLDDFAIENGFSCLSLGPALVSG